MADVIWLGGLVCAVCVVQLVHARLVRNEIVRMLKTMPKRRGPNKRTSGKLPTSLSRGNMCQTDSLIKKD